jgi:hypothetical protein
MVAFKNYRVTHPVWYTEELVLGLDSHNSLGEVEAVLATDFSNAYWKFSDVLGDKIAHAFLAPTWMRRTITQQKSTPPEPQDGILDPPNCSDIKYPMGPFFRTGSLGDCLCNGVACPAVATRNSYKGMMDVYDLEEGHPPGISPPMPKDPLIVMTEQGFVRADNSVQFPSNDKNAKLDPLWPVGVVHVLGELPPEGWIRYDWLFLQQTPTLAMSLADWYKGGLDRAGICHVPPALLALDGSLPALKYGAVPLLGTTIEFQAGGGVALYPTAYEPGLVEYWDTEAAPGAYIEVPNYPLTQGGPEEIDPNVE